MAGKVPHEGKLAIKGEGNQRLTSVHDPQVAGFLGA